MTQSVAPGIHAPLRAVAPNIYALRLPLPFALNHVNCYLLADEEDGRGGWTIIDAGLNRELLRLDRVGVHEHRHVARMRGGDDLAELRLRRVGQVACAAEAGLARLLRR